MIIKFSNPIKNSFYDVVNYHEKKEKEGKGKEIYTTMLGLDKNEKVKEMDQTKNKSASNYGFDISFNFNKKDQLTDEKAMTIIGKFMEDTKFLGNDFVINKHTDKDYQHYHLTICNYNREGVKNKWVEGFYKKDVLKLARQYEKDYGLVETIETGKTNISIKEKNAKLYAYQKLAKQYFKGNDDAKSKLSAIESVKLYDELLTNNEVKFILKKHTDVLKFCKDNEKSVLNKIGIRDDLMKHLKGSKTSIEFIQKIKDDKFYVDHKKKGNYYEYVYGKEVNGKTIYLNEKSLPKELRYYHINNNFNKSVGRTEEDKAKSFIGKMGNRVLKTCSSYEDFKTELEKYDIKVVESSNARGVYGISFETVNNGKTIRFKGSEIDRGLSYTKINQKFTISSYDKKIKQMKEKSGGKGQPKRMKQAKQTNDYETDQHIDQERKRKEEGESYDI